MHNGNATEEKTDKTNTKNALNQVVVEEMNDDKKD